MKKSNILLIAFLFLFVNAFTQDSTQILQPVLPLQIINVDARVVNKNVQLIWTVNSNEDAKSFEVERTEDEVNFRKIGGKLSLGRAGTESYEFVDALPKKNTPFSYRIKIVAKDGPAIYSALRSVKITEAALECRLKQNPVRNSIEIQVTAPEPCVLKAEVYSTYGQKVVTESTKLTAGINNLSISSQNLQPGVHRLVLETSTERKVLSFVKE